MPLTNMVAFILSTLLLLLLGAILVIVWALVKIYDLKQDLKTSSEWSRTKSEQLDILELRLEEVLNQLLDERIAHQQKLKDARADALKKSRAVLRGQATEHLAPLIQSNWEMKDFRFIGNPIDFLICSGSSAILDGKANEIEEIVLLDIKTNKSSLNKTQRRIRDAVLAGRVAFAVYNTDTHILRYWKNEEKTIEENDEEATQENT